MSSSAITLLTPKASQAQDARAAAPRSTLRAADASTFRASLARADQARQPTIQRPELDRAQSQRARNAGRKSLREASRDSRRDERAIADDAEASDRAAVQDEASETAANRKDAAVDAHDDAHDTTDEKTDSSPRDEAADTAAAQGVGLLLGQSSVEPPSALSGDDADSSLVGECDGSGGGHPANANTIAPDPSASGLSASHADQQSDGAAVNASSSASDASAPSLTVGTTGAQPAHVATAAAPQATTAPTPIAAHHAAPEKPALPQVQTTTEEINVGRVARGLRGAVNQQGGSLTLRLHPPELGFVRIEMKLSEGVVRAQLTTETNAARSMLQQSMSHLRDALTNHGLTVDRLDVQSAQNQGAAYMSRDDASPDDGRSRGQFQQQGRRESDRGGADGSAGSSGRAGFDETLINAVA